jgi:hypothetical protein
MDTASGHTVWTKNIAGRYRLPWTVPGMALIVWFCIGCGILRENAAAIVAKFMNGRSLQTILQRSWLGRSWLIVGTLYGAVCGHLFAAIAVQWVYEYPVFLLTSLLSGVTVGGVLTAVFERRLRDHERLCVRLLVAFPFVFVIYVLLSSPYVNAAR